MEQKKHYLVYQITNKVNDKIYVGAHETFDPNDDYMGSGEGIKLAIKKYGKESFQKTILQDFSDKESMYAYEAKIVNEEFVASPDTYNRKVGGYGGFAEVNRARKSWTDKQWKEFGEKISKSCGEYNRSPERRAISARTIRRYNEEHPDKPNPRLGYKYSDEERLACSLRMLGDKNPNFGKHWLFDADGNKVVMWDGSSPKPENLFLKEELYQFQLSQLPTSQRMHALATHNRRWINDGVSEKYVHKDEVEAYLATGWIKGRVKKIFQAGPPSAVGNK